MVHEYQRSMSTVVFVKYPDMPGVVLIENHLGFEEDLTASSEKRRSDLKRVGAADWLVLSEDMLVNEEPDLCREPEKLEALIGQVHRGDLWRFVCVFCVSLVLGSHCVVARGFDNWSS